MSIKHGIINRLRRLVLPFPVTARHREYSCLLSEDDAFSRPSGRLLDLSLEAARLARKISLEDVCARIKTGVRAPEVWPGEHYKLLAGLVLALRPKCVVEIGTFTGLSALTLKKCLEPGSKVFTFDIVPWNKFPDTCLTEDDFSDGRLLQHVSDLSDHAECYRHRELLGAADLIFIDAPKDGITELKLLENFRKSGLKPGTVLVFDDIRLWNMLKIWREIRLPKLDLTSFGHWSGTGIAEWE